MLDVVWLQRAVNNLAEIWNEGDSAFRRELTSAANTVDRRSATTRSARASQGRGDVV
jgi:hypothetical protein